MGQCLQRFIFKGTGMRASGKRWFLSKVWNERRRHSGVWGKPLPARDMALKPMCLAGSRTATLSEDFLCRSSRMNRSLSDLILIDCSRWKTQQEQWWCRNKMRLHSGKCFTEYKEFHPHSWLLFRAKNAYRRGSAGTRTSCEESWRIRQVAALGKVNFMKDAKKPVTKHWH